MSGASETPVGLTYYPKAQAEFKPPLIANENAFLGDISSSEKNDATSPISAGFYRLEKGTFDLSTFSRLFYCIELTLSQERHLYTPTPTTR